MQPIFSESLPHTTQQSNQSSRLIIADRTIDLLPKIKLSPKKMQKFKLKDKSINLENEAQVEKMMENLKKQKDNKNLDKLQNRVESYNTMRHSMMVQTKRMLFPKKLNTQNQNKVHGKRSLSRTLQHSSFQKCYPMKGAKSPSPADGFDDLNFETSNIELPNLYIDNPSSMSLKGNRPQFFSPQARYTKFDNSPSTINENTFESATAENNASPCVRARRNFEFPNSVLSTSPKGMSHINIQNNDDNQAIINFNRLNKKRLKQNYQFTQQRNQIFQEGGLQKFQRTKRQTYRLHQQPSMFLSTHLMNSEQARMMQENDSTSILEDTSMNEHYDSVMPNKAYLRGISQNQHSSIGNVYDHNLILDGKIIVNNNNTNDTGFASSESLQQMQMERQSYLSQSVIVSRKDLFRKFRDHLKEKTGTDKLVKDQMDLYYTNTIKSEAFRDASLDQSSKELERQNTKILRMQNQFNTIAAYRHELNMKYSIIDKVQREYPELIENNRFNPMRDIHNLTFIELNFKLQMLIQQARLLRAAIRIQKYWRSKNSAVKSWEHLKLIMKSVRVIQRYWKSWRCMKLVRKHNIDKKREAATIAQKFMRGYVSRLKTLTHFMVRHLDGNYQYFQEMLAQQKIDSAILITYHWRKYLKKKQKKVKRANQGGKSTHKHVDGPAVRRHTVAPVKKQTTLQHSNLKEASNTHNANDLGKIKLQLGDKQKSVMVSLAPAVRFSEKLADKDKSEGLNPQKTMLSIINNSSNLNADDMITEDQESVASRTSKQTSKQSKR